MNGPQIYFDHDALGDRTVLRVEGELDLAGADAFVEQVCSALEQRSRVVLDLRGVTFIDAAGIRALLTCQTSAARNGWDFWIWRASRPVGRVIEASGLSGMFRILPR